MLADSDICCIDEFDRTSRATRDVLHDVVERPTPSITKGDIICNRNAGG